MGYVRPNKFYASNTVPLVTIDLTSGSCASMACEQSAMSIHYRHYRKRAIYFV